MRLSAKNIRGFITLIYFGSFIDIPTLVFDACEIGSIKIVCTEITKDSYNNRRCIYRVR